MRAKGFHPAKNRRVTNDYFIVPERLGDEPEALEEKETAPGIPGMRALRADVFLVNG